MDQKLLKILGTRDAVWTAITKYEQQLNKILENGLEKDEDVVVLQMAIRTVLAEIICRRAEMKVDDE